LTFLGYLIESRGMRKLPLAWGTAAAAIAFCLSWALAVWGFGRLYYLGALLPLAGFLFLSAAWFMSLRGTDLLRSPGKDTPGSREKEGGAERDSPASPVAGIFAPREGLVPRRPMPDESRPGSPDSPFGARAVFLVAAAELFILATVLFFFGKVGSTFYIP
jgi:hypothetical protein